MKVTLHNGKTVSACQLIPSRGRAELMLKLMPKMQSVWNRPGTYLAVDFKETYAYRKVFEALPKVKPIFYRNPDALVGRALETLRKVAVEAGYQYYVMTDDNCVYTRESFEHLVRATAEWGSPVHMAGAHPTAAFFDKRKQEKIMVERNGIRSYEKMAWIFRCVPHSIYAAFSYPDLPCYADRYLSMWMISKGYYEFRATPDAPFDKRRFVNGGIGEKGSRARTSLGLAMMANDFPETWGHHEVRIPWTEIIKTNKVRSATSTRTFTLKRPRSH